MKADDLTNRRFGRLLVIERAGSHVSAGGQTKPLWLCLCDCGKTVLVQSARLKRGTCQSCGCYHDDVRHTATKTHGGSGERLYTIWIAMKRRCEKSSCDAYRYYGERGIKVCAEWHSYAAFREWAMNNGYDDSLSIDRIDNSLGYEPSNCRWAETKQQANNQRRNVHITFDGETKTRTQWADALGVSGNLLRDRMARYGWSADRAISEPVRRTQQNG